MNSSLKNNKCQRHKINTFQEQNTKSKSINKVYKKKSNSDYNLEQITLSNNREKLILNEEERGIKNYVNNALNLYKKKKESL